jgi:hypothetical protein
MHPCSLYHHSGYDLKIALQMPYEDLTVAQFFLSANRGFSLPSNCSYRFTQLGRRTFHLARIKFGENDVIKEMSF